LLLGWGTANPIAGRFRAIGARANVVRSAARVPRAERVSDIAAEVKRATGDQVQNGAGIAQAMEQIASAARC
jgi:hypothetical protein